MIPSKLYSLFFSGVLTLSLLLLYAVPLNAQNPADNLKSYAAGGMTNTVDIVCRADISNQITETFAVCLSTPVPLLNTFRT